MAKNQLHICCIVCRNVYVRYLKCLQQCLKSEKSEKGTNGFDLVAGFFYWFSCLFLLLLFFFFLLNVSFFFVMFIVSCSCFFHSFFFGCFFLFWLFLSPFLVSFSFIVFFLFCFVSFFLLLFVSSFLCFISWLLISSFESFVLLWLLGETWSVGRNEPNFETSPRLYTFPLKSIHPFWPVLCVVGFAWCVWELLQKAEEETGSPCAAASL